MHSISICTASNLSILIRFAGQRCNYDRSNMFDLSRHAWGSGLFCKISCHLRGLESGRKPLGFTHDECMMGRRQEAMGHWSHHHVIGKVKSPLSLGFRFWQATRAKLNSICLRVPLGGSVHSNNQDGGFGFVSE